jgi:hypothetical protein
MNSTTNSGGGSSNRRNYQCAGLDITVANDTFAVTSAHEEGGKVMRGGGGCSPTLLLWRLREGGGVQLFTQAADSDSWRKRKRTRASLLGNCYKFAGGSGFRMTSLAACGT